MDALQKKLVNRQVAKNAKKMARGRGDEDV
jgi:hypothetical protein